MLWPFLAFGLYEVAVGFQYIAFKGALEAGLQRLAISALVLAVCFYFRRRARINAVDVRLDCLALKSGDSVIEIPYKDMVRTRYLGWKGLEVATRNGVCHRVDLGVERPEYIVEAIRYHAPDAVLSLDFDRLRRNLVRADHQFARVHEYSSGGGLVAWALATVLTGVILGCGVWWFKKNSIVIRDPVGYVLLLATIYGVMSAGVSQVLMFIFLAVNNYHLQSQMVKTGDKRRDKAFERRVGSGMAVAMMGLTLGFTFLVGVSDAEFHRRLAYDGPNAPHLGLTPGQIYGADLRRNCLECAYNLKNGDLVAYSDEEGATRFGRIVNMDRRAASGRGPASASMKKHDPADRRTVILESAERPGLTLVVPENRLEARVVL